MKANSRPTRQSCRMSVPMVICPWAMLLERLSSRHLTTIEVDDMDTCRPHNTQLWLLTAIAVMYNAVFFWN